MISTFTHRISLMSQTFDEYDLFVEVYLLKDEEGGWGKALWQGCRAPHLFGDIDEMHTSTYHFVDEPPHPGESSQAFLKLINPEAFYGQLFSGMTYGIWDGKVFARGKILQVLNLRLNH